MQIRRTCSTRADGRVGTPSRASARPAPDRPRARRSAGAGFGARAVADSSAPPAPRFRPHRACQRSQLAAADNRPRPTTRAPSRKAPRYRGKLANADPIFIVGHFHFPRQRTRRATTPGSDSPPRSLSAPPSKRERAAALSAPSSSPGCHRTAPAAPSCPSHMTRGCGAGVSRGGRRPAARTARRRSHRRDCTSCAAPSSAHRLAHEEGGKGDEAAQGGAGRRTAGRKRVANQLTGRRRASSSSRSPSPPPVSVTAECLRQATPGHAAPKITATGRAYGVGKARPDCPQDTAQTPHPPGVS